MSEETDQTIKQDKLYSKAVELVIANQKASIAFLQRTLLTGYNHCARLIEAMESEGIVSRLATDGTRKVLKENISHGPTTEINASRINGPVSHEALAKLLAGMVDAFDVERQKTEPYKEMFKAGSTFSGLLRQLENECMKHVLDACEVCNQKTGKGVSVELMEFLLVIPYLSYKLEKHIAKADSGCCHVDKSFFLLSEEMKRIVGD